MSGRQFFRDLVPSQLVNWYLAHAPSQQLFEGVYQRYEDASALAKNGFTRTDVVAYFIQRARDASTTKFKTDHSAWLGLLINRWTAGGSNVRICDIGGGAGQAYFAIRSQLAQPERVQWEIYEVDEAVPAIAAFLSEQNVTNVTVHRSSDFQPQPHGQESGTIAILHIDDALQYLSDPLSFIQTHASSFDYCAIAKMHTSPTIPTFVALQKNIPAACTFVNLGELTQALQHAHHRVLTITNDERPFNMANFDHSHRLDHRRNLYSANVQRVSSSET